MGLAAMLSPFGELRPPNISNGLIVHGASRRSRPLTEDGGRGGGGPDVVGGGPRYGVAGRTRGTFSFSASRSGCQRSGGGRENGDGGGLGPDGVSGSKSRRGRHSSDVAEAGAAPQEVRPQEGTRDQVAGFHSEIPGDPHRKEEEGPEGEGGGRLFCGASEQLGKGVGGGPGPISGGPNGGAKGCIQADGCGGAEAPGLIHGAPWTGGKLHGLHQLGDRPGTGGGD